MNEKQQWYNGGKKKSLGDLKDRGWAPNSEDPYTRMEFPPLEPVTGILPEEKQEIFRAMNRKP